jgi:uncharacterized protein
MWRRRSGGSDAGPYFHSIMLSAKKILYRTLKLLVGFYVILCTVLYFFQERLIFLPEKLDQDYRFSFDQPFEEINIKTGDDNFLNGLLFKSDSAKGLVFYLHGNAGSLRTWAAVHKRYTELNYDVFILDYPGYGKSTGFIKSEEQLLMSIQACYDSIKKRYGENRITILGYSIGTGPAAYLASVSHPRMLILQAPYYNLTDMMRRRFPVIPTFLLKYKFQTNEYLKKCEMPVVVVHGSQDEVIDYGSSLKLSTEMKRGDTLITLNGQGHNGITDNADYMAAIEAILR